VGYSDIGTFRVSEQVRSMVVVIYARAKAVVAGPDV